MNENQYTDAVHDSMMRQEAAKAKRVKPRSRAKRWADAVSSAQQYLSEAQAARDKVMEAIAELKEIQEEFVNWKDNLPENLANSPLGEKLEEICNLDLEPEESDLEKMEEVITEAESADLPLGFGRD